MNVVAAVFADFEHTFLGGPSQLLTPLAGKPVLRRTLLRLREVEGVDRRCLFVRSRDQGAAEQVVREAELSGAVDVLPLDPGARPRRELLRAARKWNLEAWRGSPLGTTWFDEFVEPFCVARVMEHYGCNSVLCLDGHMPVFDPQIATAMLRQERDYEDESKMVFTQAPPGLAGVVVRRELTRELLQQDLPLGLLLSYRPEMPRNDPINQPACLAVDPKVAQTPARLTADTRRSRDLLTAALAELGDAATANELCVWFRQPGHDRAGPLPIEVEIELTTTDPLPETTLRPRGSRVPERHLADIAPVEGLARELAAWDDRFIVLGGHGDPLAHPKFGDVCRVIRAAGVCGLAVVTPLVELSDYNLEALLATRVDILQVRLDAATAETYRRVYGCDGFEHVLANIDRIQQARRARVSPQPIVVPSLTRCSSTMADLEPFYDQWIRETGWAMIEGYNGFCGMLPSDTLLHTTPPLRGPCRRLDTRVMLLADGVAAICGQDYRGVHPVGCWASEPISEIWRGERLTAARQAHQRLQLGGMPLCGCCREWFRP